MKMPHQWTSGEIIEFAKRVDKKTWGMIAISSAAFLLALVFVIFPAWIERPLLRRDIESMQAQIRQVNALSHKRAAWEQDEKTLGALIQKTQERVFTADALGLLLGQISKMASESRVDVLASKPFNDKILFLAPYNAKYQPSGYEFTMQGGYHDLGTLVSLIESYEKLMRIQSIQIVSSEKSPERHICGLKLWAIVAPPPVAPGKAPGVGAKSAKK
jgi:hypothetical protein